VFTYKGRNMGNHNRLLGRVEGMDGIKTGYTRMSGFNLVSSVRRGNRHIVAVVLGGKSAGQRDARMRDLIEARIVQASIKRTAPKATEIAAAQEPVRQEPVKQETAKPARVAFVAPATTEAKAEAPARADIVAVKTEANKPIPLVPQPAAGSTDPIKPRLVKTVAVRPGLTQVASLAPMPLPDTAGNDAPAHETHANDRPLSPPPGARPGVLGVLTAKDFKEQSRVASETTASAAIPSSPARASARVSRETVKPRSGWIIQVGAFPDKSEALQKIETVKSKASKYVSDADSFTETVSKGDKTLYRARFAGFKQQQAEAACRYLKQNDFACMAIRN
jgi:D-alanyl-D-alanine carboxypeptidase